MRILLVVLVLSTGKIFCSEEKPDSVEKTAVSSSSSIIPSSSIPSSFLWNEEEEEEEETEILVFEDERSRKEDDVLGFEPEEESLKTKRNSLSETSGNSQELHSSLPKAAALQSIPQGRQGGPLTPHNRGQIFQGGFNFPRNPSCGMCSRERNLCQIISGIFTRSPLPYGYSLVTPIPAGVCNITIVEIKPSKNFFALRRKEGNYVLNGNWKIEAAGNYGISGTLFSYSPSDGTRGEKLEAAGPLIEPIDLMIIYQSPNPGIKYEYRVPIHDLIGQQTPARILPVLPKHGGTSNTYNIDAQIKVPNKFPSSHANVPVQGGTTHLSGRTPFPGTSRSTPQNPAFQQVPSAPKDNSQVPINNWNSGFIPGANRPPPNQAKAPSTTNLQPTFNQAVGSIYPPQISTSTHFTNSGPSRPDSTFKPERFPGVLNTDPRIVPSRHFPPETKHTSLPPQSSSSNSNTGQTNKRTGVSYTPRTSTNVGRGNASKKRNKKTHRTRHNHGSRDILPGPAVGGNGHSPIAPGKDSNFPGITQPRHSFKTSDGPQRSSSPEKRKRRRRKKGKKKDGEKGKNRYHWVFKGLTKCSKTCGGGNQTSVFSCERRRKGKVVADRFCKGVQRVQQKVISCNLKPCPAKWVPGEWGVCSVTCGIGVQTRPLLCKQDVSPSFTMMVPEGACLSPKVGNTTKICKLDECPSPNPKWKTGAWSNCSTKCGIGKKTRDLQCIVMNAVVDALECAQLEPKPAGEETCDMGSCATNTWFFSKWSDTCSNACGEGIQTRIVMCMMTEEDSRISCPSYSRPNMTRSCTGNSGCGGKWFAGPWSECSVSCGTGRETRSVKCLESSGNRWSITSDENCRENLKPPLARECSLEPCHPEWFTSEWKQCSVSCGKGFQDREVKCLNSQLQSSPSCFNATKPETRRHCNDFDCGKDLPNSQRRIPKQNDLNRQWTFKEKKDFIEDSLKLMPKVEEGYKELNPKSNRESNEVNKERTDDDTSSPKRVNLATEDSTNDIREGEDDGVIDNDDDNQQTNELEVTHETGSALNAIPDKDAQGDESVVDDQDEKGRREDEKEKREDEKDKTNKKKEKKNKSKADNTPKKETPQYSCIDRIKNCHLVFRARLCRLKYYNKLCCLTCQGSSR